LPGPPQMFRVFHRFALPALVCVAAVAVTARVRAVDENALVARVAAAVERAGQNGGQAANDLDALVAEAAAAGDHAAQVVAGQALARLKARAGNLDDAREEIEAALKTARQFGLTALEAPLSDAYAEILLAGGDVDLAAAWLERGFQIALAQSPPQRVLARELLTRLADLHRSIGQQPRAAQADAWLALLAGDSNAAQARVEFQPIDARVQVASDEVARTRLVLSNATAGQISGTLWLDRGDVQIKQWKSRAGDEWVVLGFPDGNDLVPSGVTQGRKITLGPGEQRFITVELEPFAPPRLAEESVTFRWEGGGAVVSSMIHFYFVQPAQLSDPGVSNASHVRLSPYVSIPVYEEIYYRGEDIERIESFLPATSGPCRIEIYELGRLGSANDRTLLAIDANGDGRFDGSGDDVLSDRDGDGFPDVRFNERKSVAALELRLFPLADPASSTPASLDLTISLRDGGDWRRPPDVVNRVDAR
jgi:hypothetical protein